MNLQEIADCYYEAFEKRSDFSEVPMAAALRYLSPGNRERALAAVATCIGGVAIARALQDEALVEELLAACRAAVAEGVGATSP